MKKIFVLATMMVAMVCGTYAQDTEEWYMIVNKSGASDKYVVANVDEVSVSFAKGVDSWVEYAVGDFTYDGYFISNTSTSVNHDPMTLYRNTLATSEYKIAAWGGGNDLYFTYDETTGKVVNAPVDTGVLFRALGANYWMDDLQHYALINGEDPSEYLYSYWDKENGNDTINFSVMFYIPDDDGNWEFNYTGDGSESINGSMNNYETFTISEYK